jgi:cytosolic iron-sulfur protein assembly protein CIAO1
MSVVRLQKKLSNAHAGVAWGLSWNPTGTLLASCGEDCITRVWTREPKSLGGGWICGATLDGAHTRPVRSVAFSPSGTTLASASFDGKIYIWEQQKHDENFYEDDNEDNDDTCGNSLQYLCATVLEGHENEVKSVAWSADGTMLATCSRDKSVWIWHALPDNDFEYLAVLLEHLQDVKMVRWHPSEDTLLSASYDDSVRVWRDHEDDWYCAHVTAPAHASTVWALEFLTISNPQKDSVAGVSPRVILATCSDDGSIRIWQLFTGKKNDLRLLHTVENAHSRPIYSISWAPTTISVTNQMNMKTTRHHSSSSINSSLNDLKSNVYLLASAGGDNSVKLWMWDDLAERLEPYLVIDSSAPDAHDWRDVNCVAFNPCPVSLNELELATCGDDGSLCIWTILRE